MILYSYSVCEGSEKNINMECSHCGANHMVVTMMQKIFSLFGILSIPCGKIYTISCQECNTSYDPESLGVDMNSIKMRYTWRVYYKWVVLMMVVVFVQIQSYIDAKNIKTYLESPKVGDVILYESKEDKETPYGFFKIIKITGDDVLVLGSKFVYEKRRDARDKLDESKNENFLTEEELLQKEDLKHMNIKDWVRKLDK